MGKKKLFISFCVICLIAILSITAGLYKNEQVIISKQVFTGLSLQETKIFLISDLHDHIFDEENQEIVNMIHDENPDLILMLGDFINDDSEDEAGLLHLVSALKEISPVYYALGNHEIEYMNRTGIDLTGKIEGLGVEVLDLEYEDIIVNGNKIRIGGMYDYAFALDGNNTCNPDRMKPEVYSFLSEFQDTDSFKLMLSHCPESFIVSAKC